jgi:C4-dicarboxylate-specific signal transduction histidine kinase
MSGDRTPQAAPDSGRDFGPEDRRSIDEEPSELNGGLDGGRGLEDRLDRLRDDRLATIADLAPAWAHELTQPLTAAANYLSAARSLVGGNSDAIAALDRAATQMVRAGRIVGRLREFMARGDPGTLAQSLHDVIRAASELAAPALRQANVKLTLRLEAAQDLVLVDRVEIEQALINLIRHAAGLACGCEDRTITIGTSVANGTIQTDIVDARSRVSESVDARSPEPLNPIACSIIEAHRGRVSAASGRDGGVIVGFALPLVEPDRFAR